MSDFLGSDPKKTKRGRKFKEFSKARDYVRLKGFKTIKEYQIWSKSGERPSDIPTDPVTTYTSQGWIDWSDYLGINIIATYNIQYRSYEEAKKLIQELKFADLAEFSEWAKSDQKPVDIPVAVSSVYREKGWISWSDFLGTDPKESKNINFRDFETARSFIGSLKFKSKTEYTLWSKSEDRPFYVPASPSQYYKYSGWISWPDWLGTVKDK